MTSGECPFPEDNSGVPQVDLSQPLQGAVASGQLGMLGLQDNKKMKKSLEEEQRARKDLEKLVRKVLKNMNDPAWDETNL